MFNIPTFFLGTLHPFLQSASCTFSTWAFIKTNPVVLPSSKKVTSWMYLQVIPTSCRALFHLEIADFQKVLNVPFGLYVRVRSCYVIVRDNLFFLIVSDKFLYLCTSSWLCIVVTVCILPGQKSLQLNLSLTFTVLERTCGGVWGRPTFVVDAFG